MLNQSWSSLEKLQRRLVSNLRNSSSFHLPLIPAHTSQLPFLERGPEEQHPWRLQQTPGGRRQEHQGGKKESGQNVGEVRNSTHEIQSDIRQERDCCS